VALVALVALMDCLKPGKSCGSSLSYRFYLFTFDSSLYFNMTNCSTKASPRIKRARNPWIIYRSETLKVLSPADLRRTQQELSRLISARWKRESDEVKEVYKKLAVKEKTQHKLLYPDYVYRPRRKRRGNSSSEEKLAMGKRKQIVQQPISETAVEHQALEPTTAPSNSESGNLPGLAICEEVQNTDFTCYPNGTVNQAQASTSQVGCTEICLK
jgi:hypothetical protein